MAVEQVIPLKKITQGFFSAVKKKLKLFFKARFNTWLTKRVPASTKQILSNRNVFIFPTRFGFAYLFFVLLLFLLATNYQNNVIMLLSYLLASLFISAMLHSFFNLAGLTVTAKKHTTGFAGSHLYLPITLYSANARFSLVIGFDDQTDVIIDSLEHEQSIVNRNSNTFVAIEQQVLVPFYAAQRGLLIPSRLKISSEYSLGLFTCWTRLDFAAKLIVYPKAEKLKLGFSYQKTQENEQASQVTTEQGDDFYQLKNYVVGESLSQVAWKQVAKGQGWLSKSYHQSQGGQYWLKLADMPAVKLEQKLSFLCYLVMEYYQTGQKYALELDHIKIIPSNKFDHPQQHLEQCLYALAIFDPKSANLK